MLLKVSSLNFSGINISPFEYHDGSSEKIHINSCFKRLLNNYQLENPKEYGSIAKLDLIFQKNRYTILYKSNVGVLRGKLISREQFETIWDLMFEQNQDNMKSIPIKNSDVEILKTFDRMIYEAFLEHIYGQIDWANIKEYDPQLYQSELRKWHSKCYLKLDRKSQLLRQYLVRKNLDILFLQEAEVEHVSKTLPHNYTYTHSSKSMIIVKKDLFAKDPISSDFQVTYKETLDFNKDSTFIKFKDYLLMSVHLSSKKIKIEQLENMKRTLTLLAQEQPNLKIIVGIDANQFIKKIDSFNIFPLSEEEFTTRKRRTDMQLQFEKAGLIVEDVKDHLITNLKMIDMNVETINCEEINTEFLPNQHHPFDHFAVHSTIVDELSQIHKENKGQGILENRKDSKSVSTLDSFKKSTGVFKQLRVDNTNESPSPTIVISPCENPPLTENMFSDLEKSEKFSHCSKNSRASKSPRTKYIQTPCLNILKFRKSTYGAHFREEKETQSIIKPEKQVFKFREINRSRSMQKSNQKTAKPTILKPPSLGFVPNINKRQENYKSQTHLSPTSYIPYKYSRYNK